MIEKFKTLFFVKSSLITLYLALTMPIPFVSIDRLKIPSVIVFVLGLYLIINITNDYVETCNNKISYKTSFISKALGKKIGRSFGKILSQSNPYQPVRVVKFITLILIKVKIFLSHKEWRISKN